MKQQMFYVQQKRLISRKQLHAIHTLQYKQNTRLHGNVRFQQRFIVLNSDKDRLNL